MVGGRLGKLVRHACGYSLQAEVLERVEVFEGCAVTGVGPAVVVCYRDPADGMLTNLCPRCGKPLQLWWSVAERGES